MLLPLLPYYYAPKATLPVQAAQSYQSLIIGNVGSHSHVKLQKGLPCFLPFPAEYGAEHSKNNICYQALLAR